MEYVLSDGTTTYYYDVSFDEDKLKEIMERLKEYSYTAFDVKISIEDVSIFPGFPVSDRTIRKRTIEYYNNNTLESCLPEAKIYPDSIIRHKDVGSMDFISFLISYRKLPDLYDFLDLLVNNKKIKIQGRLFSDYIFNTLYLETHRDQVLIEKLLGYVESSELVDHYKNGLGKKYRPSVEDYDYAGLRELYSEALKALKFTLKAKKEEVLNEEPVDGLHFSK